jgi:peptidoglycan hydrolase CwlO-like protein
MPKQSAAHRSGGKPRIDAIVQPVITPGVAEFLQPGKPLASGAPGTLVLLVGNGFGKKADAVRVHFGTAAADPYPPPLFSDNFVVATVPLAPHGHVAVRVEVAGVASNEVAFRIARRAAIPEPPGTLTLKALTSLDAFAVLVAAEIRVADFGRFADREFQNELAAQVEEARKGLLDAREQFVTAHHLGAELANICETPEGDIQQLILRIGERVAQRSRRYFDQIVQASQILPELDLAMHRIRQGGTTTATKTLEIVSEVAGLAADFASAAESAAQSIAGSADIGVGASADVSGNATVAVAAALSAVGKAIATGARIAALLSRNADADRQDQEELEHRRRIEAKLDRAEGKLDKVESKLERIESKEDKSESKLDHLEQKADQAEMKNDKLEVKLDRVEQKLDKNEIKKDYIEAKLDRVEPKLDRVEAKLDRQEEKLDKLESKADKAERKLDRLEGKSDRAESKLDKLEGKADRAEGKLDRLEGKSDKAEGKLDKLEGKADKAEGKLDKLEGKADKAEIKIDKLEGKIDKEEIKLDRLLIRADQNKEFWQFSPVDWQVSEASATGVQVQNPLSGAVGTAFSVESIQIPKEGFKVTRLVVDGIATDVSASNITTPSNVLVTLGVALIGASRSVSIEFETPYSGPVEFNGQKPQGLRLCTVVQGPGSSQTSPKPCQT